MPSPPLRSTLFPYTTLFRSGRPGQPLVHAQDLVDLLLDGVQRVQRRHRLLEDHRDAITAMILDRKSTRLNSSHGYISYAVFCLKKKKQTSRLTLFIGERYDS